ncbi:hypothetical protein ACIA8K_08755 [Catenuloplanes sp. NPDC051500]|uniref:hypothetical protein n=1 Tax=Catenuloplanes sp. NPDC051500 TaxID=3363959 RepID=UPI0037A91F9E
MATWWAVLCVFAKCIDGGEDSLNDRIGGGLGKPVEVQRRLSAYQEFSREVWAVSTSIQAVRALAPVSRNRLGGVAWHPMMVRSVEGAGHANGRLLGAYDLVRLVGPLKVVEAASTVCTAVAELSAVLQGPEARFSSAMEEVGAAQRDFLFACRVDLGYDADPEAPAVTMSPKSWGRRAKFWWSGHQGTPLRPEADPRQIEGKRGRDVDG